MLERAVNKLYRIHEFARAAGVTGKALRHYERLGLLKPRRTAAGYRLYSETDRMRLEQIVALRFLEIPLREIRALLDHPQPSLKQALRLQRMRLQAKQRGLERAVRAIEDAERALETGTSGTALWRKVLEVIAMNSDVEAMRKYYSDEAWEKRKQHYEQWPSPAWQEICRDVASILREDPAGSKAQALKARWTESISRSVTGDPAVQAGALAAWEDRAHWPAALRAKIDELHLEQVVDFLARTLAASWKAFVASEAWARLEERQRNPTEPWNAWYLRVRSALEEDPPGEKARALVLRMTEL
jgi:DNA-binding transcriptional MerR regulator